MFGYNCFADHSASHCTAAACTSAPIVENADTVTKVVVSVFVGAVQ